jgi:hypothetical protein
MVEKRPRGLIQPAYDGAVTVQVPVARVGTASLDLIAMPGSHVDSIEIVAKVALLVVQLPALSVFLSLCNGVLHPKRHVDVAGIVEREIDHTCRPHIVCEEQAVFEQRNRI